MDKREYNMNYNKTHYIRVPLDLRPAEYNALAEYCKDNGIGINTLIRSKIVDLLPHRYIEKHKDDKERER